MLAESLLELEIGHIVASGIIVEYPVETDGFFGDYRCADDQFRLQGARSADTHHCELAVRGLYLAGIEIYIGERVEFVDHNINVVRPYAV